MVRLAQTVTLLWCTVPTVLSAAQSQNGAAFSIPSILVDTRLRTIIQDKKKMAFRYGGLAATTAKRFAYCTSGHEPAYPLQYESSYISPVGIGGQVVHLDFDTGSSDLWSMSSLLPDDQVGNHSLYNPALSSSSRLLQGSTWNVTYGDGTSAGGVVYKDQVNVGGAIVFAQSVQAATTVSKKWSKYKDGILGLAGDSLNNVKPEKQTSFFTNIAPHLRLKLFTVYLRKGEPGSYDFGFVDHTKYKGALSFVSVNSDNGLWQISAGNCTIGDNETAAGTLGTTFLDTGASLTYLPKSIVDSYYQQVENATFDKAHGGYVFPCNASLPILKLQLGENVIKIPGPLLNYAPVRSGAEICLGGIQDSPAPGISIFGDTFFKASFVVFDGNDKNARRIGFAQQQ